MKSTTESSSSSKTEETSVERSRKWAFTVKNAVPGTYQTISATVYVGPMEQSTDGPHHHGIIIATKQAGKRPPPLRRTSCVKVLEELGITTAQYLQPVKNIANYIQYMYKNRAKDEEIPEGLLAILETAKHTTGMEGYYMTVLKDLAEEFDTKPSYNTFKQKLFETCFNFPEQLARRGYEQLKWAGEDMFENVFTEMNEMAPSPDMPVEVGKQAVLKVVDSALGVTWNGETWEPTDLLIALCTLALEARDQTKDGIEIAHHICLEGAPGKGKSFLGHVLIPPTYASTLTNDSSGVGQAALRQRHKVLKIDDAGTAFFNDDKLTATVKAMYHSNWSAKTHGSRQDNSATAAFITTNLNEAVRKLAGVGTLGPFARRFVSAKFASDSEGPTFDQQFRITVRRSNEILLECCKEALKRAREQGHAESLLQFVKYIDLFVGRAVRQKQNVLAEPSAEGGKRRAGRNNVLHAGERDPKSRRTEEGGHKIRDGGRDREPDEHDETVPESSKSIPDGATNEDSGETSAVGHAAEGQTSAVGGESDAAEGVDVVDGPKKTLYERRTTKKTLKLPGIIR